MLRSLVSVAAALGAIAAFGFALNSTGLQYISSCDEAVRGPIAGVWIGSVFFVLLGAIAFKLRSEAALLLILGVSGTTVIHDQVQQKVTQDVLNSSCADIQVR